MSSDSMCLRESTNDRQTGNEPAPRYSIVMPAYNAERFIGEAVESVLAQSVSDWELIIVDDGSTDHTADEVARFVDPRIRLIHQENGGVSAARNAGILATRGKYILFFDADDILLPEALERLGGLLEENPDAVLAYGEVITFDTDTGPIPVPGAPVFAKRPTGDALEQMVVANPVGAGCALARGDVVRRTRGFETELKLGEDWLFWCMLASHGHATYAGPKPILHYRIHGQSAARKLAINPKAMWPAIDRVFSMEELRTRFSPAHLARLRQASESTALAYSGQELLKAGRFVEARHAFSGALVRRPFRLREWILWVCAAIRMVPAPIRRRLK